MSPKSFAILALATAASVGLAAYAVTAARHARSCRSGRRGLVPRPARPTERRPRDAHQHVRTGKLTVKAGDGGWTLAEKANYPVDPAKVRELALALANLQLVEAKTADPQRLKRLELEEPGGEGASRGRSSCSAAMARRWRRAVVGKTSPALYGGGRGGVYVRRAGDNQAWLAAGEIDVPTDAMTLIGSELIDVPTEQVARVVMQPPGGSASTLSRPDAAGDFVTDATLPEGRKLDPVKVESLAGTLGGLTMTDVRPASEVTLGPDARHARFETFAGGSVDVTLTSDRRGRRGRALADAEGGSARSAIAAGKCPQARRLGLQGPVIRRGEARRWGPTSCWSSRQPAS